VAQLKRDVELLEDVLRETRRSIDMATEIPAGGRASHDAPTVGHTGSSSLIKEQIRAVWNKLRAPSGYCPIANKQV